MSSKLVSIFGGARELEYVQKWIESLIVHHELVKYNPPTTEFDLAIPVHLHDDDLRKWIQENIDGLELSTSEIASNLRDDQHHILTLLNRVDRLNVLMEYSLSYMRALKDRLDSIDIYVSDLKNHPPSADSFSVVYEFPVNVSVERVSIYDHVSQKGEFWLGGWEDRTADWNSNVLNYDPVVHEVLYKNFGPYLPPNYFVHVYDVVPRHISLPFKYVWDDTLDGTAWAALADGATVVDLPNPVESGVGVL